MEDIHRLLYYSGKVGESLAFALGIFFASAYIESSELARAVYDIFLEIISLQFSLIMKKFAMQVICIMVITIKSSKVIKI